MIKKIPFETEVISYNGKNLDVQAHASPYDLQIKINELVDAVNEYEKDREEIKEWIGIVSDLRSRVPVVESRVSILEEHAHPTATTEPTYKNWIGKICKFWNWDTGLAHYSKLITIKDPKDDEIANCPFRADDGGWYMYCEPVKPDDDIIYKGE